MSSADDRLWRDARLNAGKAGGVAIAKRYSGDVVVTMIYRDVTDDYACRVVSPEGRWTTIVSGLRDARLAVDSREAFDDIARAAITFADEDSPLGVAPEYDLQGSMVVSGKPPARRTP